MGLSVKSMRMEIGVRKPKEITLYCLSMADELKFTSVISDIYFKFQEINKKKPLPEINEDDISSFMERLDEEDDFNPESIAFIIEAIRDNLMDILKMVCEEEITLADVTNEQFSDLCDAIYEMNFAGAVGKFQSLWKKIKNLFPQTKQSQKLSSIPVTPLTTSIDTPSSKED